MFALPNRCQFGRQAACRDRPRVCPIHHLSIHQDRINIRAEQGRKNLMRSADRIGMGIGQTRGLSLHADVPPELAFVGLMGAAYVGKLFRGV